MQLSGNKVAATGATEDIENSLVYSSHYDEGRIQRVLDHGNH
jgi:hypothetical protein